MENLLTISGASRSSRRPLVWIMNRCTGASLTIRSTKSPPHKRFAAIECHDRGGVPCKETAEQCGIVTQVRWEIRVNLYRCCFRAFCILFLKRLCPAIPAAEVAVISEDDMEVHGRIPVIMGIGGR